MLSAFYTVDCEPPAFLNQYSPQHEGPAVGLLPPQEPADSDSGPITPNSCSDHACKQNSSGSSGRSADERKRRRMISNRDSARRSRMRKQKHLENVRSQLHHHRSMNREVANRLRLMSQKNQFVRQENGFLRSESAMLRQRLWDIRKVLLVRQLQQRWSPSAWLTQ